MLEQKLNHLRRVLTDYGTLAVGYSGGVDSVFLAKFATDTLGSASVLALTGISASVPFEQRRMARECAARFGIRQLEVDTNELADPNYASNPANRCYYCKTELWRVLGQVASRHGLAVLADGANTDDVHDHRPGAAAGAEWSVRSPLIEAGLGKAEIRAASRALELPTWDQPAAPCLASRLPYGVAVTPARLRAIELAEQGLRALGYREFRVRHHGDAARVEFAPAELAAIMTRSVEIERAIRAAGFARVLVDVEGYRRGRLNEALPLVQLGTVR